MDGEADRVAGNCCSMRGAVSRSALCSGSKKRWSVKGEAPLFAQEGLESNDGRGDGKEEGEQEIARQTSAGRKVIRGSWGARRLDVHCPGSDASAQATE